MDHSWSESEASRSQPYALYAKRLKQRANVHRSLRDFSSSLVATRNIGEGTVARTTRPSKKPPAATQVTKRQQLLRARAERTALAAIDAWCAL